MKKSYQDRVIDWAYACFPTKTFDNIERGHRFIEECLELVQATGMSKEDVLTLVDYVYDRPVGEIKQEIGGVMVTIACFCHVLKEDMDKCGEDELESIWGRIEQIRSKQANKPRDSALPQEVN